MIKGEVKPGSRLTRQRVLDALIREPMSAKALSVDLNLSIMGVRYHLQVLIKDGLVKQGAAVIKRAELRDEFTYTLTAPKDEKQFNVFHWRTNERQTKLG